MGCGASQADPPPQKARPPAPPQQQYAQQQYAQQQQQQQPRLVAVSPLQAPGYGYTAQQVVYVPHSSHAPPLSAQTPLERPREPSACDWLFRLLFPSPFARPSLFALLTGSRCSVVARHDRFDGAQGVASSLARVVRTASSALHRLFRIVFLTSHRTQNYASGANNPTKRRDTVCEALRLLVPRLGEHDTAGEDEEDGGGLRTVTFADGEAHDIGDLSVSNLQQKFNAIRWAGGTYSALRCASWERELKSLLTCVPSPIPG